MIFNYLIAFSLAFFLSIILTLIVRKIALRLKIVDLPNLERKIHHNPIPLLGGVAVFFSFIFVLIYYSLFTNLVIGGFILPKHIVGLILAGLIIMVGGVLDDKFNLRPKYQIIFPLLAIVIVIVSGIGISQLRNPFGGTLSLKNWDLILFWYRGLPYKITLLADLFTFLWLLGMMYTTKLLDGLDGLVAGVTVIGSFIVFFVSLSKTVVQPNTALIAIILAGAFAGFLIFNFNPARIFLGEGGSLFAGLMLGVLSILAGSKIATALLIMGIPILDVVWTIIRRLRSGKNPFTFADRKHLHFRLLDVGLSQKQAVSFLYCLTALFGSLTLFLQSFGKLIALMILAVVMLILVVILVFIYQRKNKYGG